MIRMFGRKMLVAAGWVVAFVAVFAAIGAVSRSTPAVAAAPLPFLPWYWSMVVSPSDPNLLVLGTSNGLYRSSDGGKTWAPTGPKNVITTSLVQSGSSIVAGGVPGTPTPTARPWVRKGSFRTAPDGSAVLAASTDGGKSWQELHPRGLPNVSVQALAANPANREFRAGATESLGSS